MSRKTVRNYDIDMEQITYQRQSFVSEIATGFYGVWWSLTHPSKTLWLSLPGCVTDYELPKQANSLNRKWGKQGKPYP
jgi:hypothetical protein